MKVQPKAGRAEKALARFHEEDSVKAYDAKNLLRLWPFLAPQKAPLVGSLLLLSLSSVLALARPLIMRAGLDGASGDAGAVTRAGLLLTGAMVIEQAIAFPQMVLMQVAGARAMGRLRSRVFGFLHTRSLSYFDKTPMGRLVTRVTSDVDSIGEMFASGALNAVGDLVRLAVIIGILLWMDWQMSLVAFVALPPVLLGVNFTRKRIREAFREVRLKTARMNSYLNEQVSGMALVQAYAREEDGAREFDEQNDAYRKANNSSIVWDATMDAAIELISSLCVASVLWAAGSDVLSKHVTFGTLFAFVAYIDMFFLPIRDLSSRYTLVQSAMTGAERVFELLDNRDEDAPRRDEQAGPDRPGEALSFEDVTFGYKPDVLALRNVTFTVAPGERIALVGATGAGKSTVSSLLLRLYETNEGTVRVLGKDVRAWNADDLRKRFAVVPQDVFLFRGTVASNIAAGEAEPDLERVRKALREIGALERFEGREGGLLSDVRERGSNFSSGERQLIAFARALYKKPEILILDEATANVDSDTEASLQRAVEGALANRTSLVIAHRLSTIRSADRVLVFHRGQVVEQGSHAELVLRGGVYSKLHALQFERIKKADFAQRAVTTT